MTDDAMKPLHPSGQTVRNGDTALVSVATSSTGSEHSGDRDPLDRLAEEFAERCRRGESPSVAEYEARFPDQAAKVRKLLGAVAMMEQLRRGSRQARFMPERIGEFRVLRELGRGGMGVVYEAVQESLWRHVAVKAIHHTQLDMKRLQRFQREAQAVAQLHHTNIVPIFGVGEHDGIPYYAMQYIRGRGLDAVLDSWRKDGFLPTMDRWRLAAKYAIQAAGALNYAHEQGVLHRDIKPANLLIDEHDAVWITDFGLAKMVGHEELTASGDVIGTLRYLAPESLRGISEGRSDVYSLGLTLYEMLTLRPPFGDLTPSELLHRVSEGQPVRPRQVDPMIPLDLETIVLKATARDLKDRYATASALADDLQCFLNDRPIAARRVNFIERAWRWSRRNRTTAALTALAAVAVIVAAVAGWTGYLLKNQALQVEKISLNQAERNLTQLNDLFSKLFESLFPEETLENDPEDLPLTQPSFAPNDDSPTTQTFTDRLALGPPRSGPGPGLGREGGLMLDRRLRRPDSPFGPGPSWPGDHGPGGRRDDFGGGPPMLPSHGFGGDGGPDLGGGGGGGGPGGRPTSRFRQSDLTLLKNILASYDEFAQAQNNRTNALLQSEAAWVYFKVGTLSERFGDRKQADQAFDRALGIFDQLSAQYPLNPTYFGQFFQICSAINPWQTDPELRTAVERRLNRMAAALDRLLRSSPENAEMLRARMQLLAKLGLIRHWQGRPDFEAAFREALEMAGALIARDPEEGYPHSNRSDVLEAYALVLEDQQRLAEARQLLESAMEDLEWVAADGLLSEALASRMESLSDDFERCGDQSRSDQVQQRADEIDPRPVLRNRVKPAKPFGPRRAYPGPDRDGPPSF